MSMAYGWDAARRARVAGIGKTSAGAGVVGPGGDFTNGRERRIQMTKRFEKLICLVTGGSTGIGAAVARELAQERATVLITGRHEETLRASAAQHPAIRYIVADVSKAADSARVIEELRTKYGRLDVLVNNAGIAPIRPLTDASPDHVRE